MGGIVTCLNELLVLVEYAQVNVPDRTAPRALITYCSAVPTSVSIFTSSVVTSPSFSPTSGPPDTSMASSVVGGVIALLSLLVCVCYISTCCCIVCRLKRKVLLTCFLWRGSYLLFSCGHSYWAPPWKPFCTTPLTFAWPSFWLNWNNFFQLEKVVQEVVLWSYFPTTC